MDEHTEERLLRITLIASLFFLVVNHLTGPKAFPATQLLFDYRDGLARRGLAGEVLNLFALPEISSGEIRAALVLITLSGLTALVAFLWLRLAGQRAGKILLILLLNSFALASFAGNVGYLDGLLVVLCVGALATNANTNSGLLARLLVMIVGVLTHENMLPYFAMLFAFDLWLSGRRAVAFAPMVLGALMVAFLAFFTGRGPDEALAYADWLQSKSGFDVDPEATIVAGRGLAENFALMEGLRGTTQYKAWLLFDGLPLFGLTLWLIWLNLNLLGKAAARSAGLMMSAAVLAPLSLNIIAFDVVRFGVASVIVGALATALILKQQEGARTRLEATMTWPHALLVLVLVSNMFTTQVSTAAGHLSQCPWILREHLTWAK